MNLYETVIGLEVHAQLMTASKVFCTAPNQFGDEPNTCVGVVSAGLPGALPVLNKRVVELAVRAGLALNCKINLKSVFSRKNYLYPDLPKGYQISQFDLPICSGGAVEIVQDSGHKKSVELERIHIEEDAGKSVHSPMGTLVNLNRSGVPLIEIVTKPVLKSSKEAAAYLKKLHSILLFAEVCDGNMEKGNFRCDANISVRRIGEKKLGTRTELKNINSFKFIEKALEYEIARHIAVIEGGGKIVLETRGWDSAAAKTFSMRSKEEAQDYRYFPDPDLPPLVLSEQMIQQVSQGMPELPDQKRQHYENTYQLTAADAEVLISERSYSQFFEETVRAGANPKLAANWICTELLRRLKQDEGAELSTSRLTPTALAELISLIESAVISGKIAKGIFEELWKSGGSPKEIVERQGLVQVLDVSQIEAWVDAVIAEFPSQVESYRQGKDKLVGFFVGEVMKRSRGKANPPLVTELLHKKVRG